MCGIYGVQGRFQSPDIGLSAIRRRGPDKLSHWHDDSAAIWLGHARLSIIDLSAAGNQPMVSPDGRFVMVYNGEIYNFPELRDELTNEGEQFVGHSDSEILLRLFMLYGARCFTRLNGIFAAAFWDRKTETLTLVRDPMGVKPLYFSAGEASFAFASEMKALIRAGDVKPTLNRQAVLHHLGLLWSPGSGTIANEIDKLCPGEAMEVRERKIVRRWRYSDPTLPSSDQRETDSVAAAERVRTGVEAAVKRQLLSDVPLGAFLSGGLDSSSIAAFATRHRSGPGKLQCFSIEIADGSTASEGFADDLPFARKVAEHIGADLHVVRAGSEMLDRLHEMIYFLDEPTADLAALNTLMISELARNQGIKVLLSGTGGDDIFTGYRRHYALMQERWWSWLPQAARSALSASTSWLPKNVAASRRIAKAFQFAGREADPRLAGYFCWLQPEEAFGLLSADFRKDLDPEMMIAPLIETLSRVPTETTPLQKMLYLECQHFLPDHNLNYADKMGMAASIEIRVPLLDQPLVAEALAIDDGLKQRNRTGKWIFKKAMESVLPSDVIYRPKTGFGVPLRHWILGPLDGLIQNTLSHKRIAQRGIFDPAAIQRLIAANRSGSIDASYTIFAVLCLELWCTQYLDGEFAVDLDLATVPTATETLVH